MITVMAIREPVTLFLDVILLVDLHAAHPPSVFALGSKVGWKWGPGHVVWPD